MKCQLFKFPDFLVGCTMCLLNNLMNNDGTIKGWKHKHIANLHSKMISTLLFWINKNIGLLFQHKRIHGLYTFCQYIHALVTIQ